MVLKTSWNMVRTVPQSASFVLLDTATPLVTIDYTLVDNTVTIEERIAPLVFPTLNIFNGVFLDMENWIDYIRSIWRISLDYPEIINFELKRELSPAVKAEISLTINGTLFSGEWLETTGEVTLAPRPTVSMPLSSWMVVIGAHRALYDTAIRNIRQKYL